MCRENVASDRMTSKFEMADILTVMAADDGTIIPSGSVPIR